MKKFVFLAVMLAVIPVTVFAETFSWIDDQGITHYTDELSTVPKKFRKKMKVLGGNDAVSDSAPVTSGSDKNTVELPAKETTETSGTPRTWQKNKKEVLYEGKTEAEWRQELINAKSELNSSQNQLSDTTARLKDTSSMTRSEYLSIHQQIKTLQASVKGNQERYDALVRSAKSAGVPEGVFR